MKSFVITFYRHGGHETPELLVGTLEDPAEGALQKFTSMAELQSFLGGAAERWERKTTKKIKKFKEEKRQ